MHFHRAKILDRHCMLESSSSTVASWTVCITAPAAVFYSNTTCEEMMLHNSELIFVDLSVSNIIKKKTNKYMIVKK